MGQHYVPQHHLRGFSDDYDKEKIWMYDKKKGTNRLLPIKAVAQSSNFYTSQAETWLNDIVERPAQEQLLRLTAHEPIDDVGRLTVAIYIQMMVFRVPHARSVFRAMAPGIAKQVTQEAKSDPSRIPDGMDKEDYIHVLDALEDAYTHQNRSDQLLRSPAIICALADMIFAMRWRIVHLGDDEAFVTGDNPVFFTEKHGLMHPDGEISFPLSSKVALHASWQGEWEGLLFVEGSQHIASEINRGTAAGAKRFVFASDGNLDITELVEKPPPLLYPFPW